MPTTARRDFGYQRLIKRHIGRGPIRGDGLPEKAIAAEEQRLRFRLPESLREWYRVAGRLKQLNEMHNFLYGPADLAVDAGYMLFMEENQAVVHWGFRLSDLSKVDPRVWQRTNCDPPKWYSQKMPFSMFIRRMLNWQAGFDAAPRPANGQR